MAAFDFDAAVRWTRSQPRTTLSRRTDDALPFLGDKAEAGRGLLLDTCVYIDQLQGRAPDVLADLLAIRQVNHSTVTVQELMHTVGVLDPAHPGTAAAVGRIGEAVKAMPAHRVFAPDPDILGKAAVLSGLLCRLQGFAKDGKLRALQDSVLFLQARKLGFTVLTSNLRDFDPLLQLIPTGRVLFYRQSVRS